MFETAEQTIERFNLIARGDRIVAAVSGGPDSMALLFFLNKIKKNYGFLLFAVHVNHMVRGVEAERDAAFVKDYCKRNSIELFSVEKNVPELSAVKRISIEEAGRAARFDAYRESLSRFSANKIATGHNKDDNAETFLLRLSRGAGTKGLSGIAPRSEVNGVCVIRPLLYCSRERIEQFCAQNEISFITDSTNEKPLYARNKMRLELIPWLRKNINTDIINTIAATTEIIREQNEFIERQAKTAYNACLVSEAENTVSIGIDSLNRQDTAIKKVIIRQALEKAGGSLKDISSAHISDILSLIEKGTGKRICLPGSMVCKTQYDKLVFGKEYPMQPFMYELLSGKPVYIKEKGFFVSFSANELESDNLKNLCTKMFKCDKMLFKLYCRTRRPGDRIKTAGGTKKLSDYFIDKKIPAEQREAAALITDNSNNVLSIFGVCDSVTVGENEFYIQFWEDKNGNVTGLDFE